MILLRLRVYICRVCMCIYVYVYVYTRTHTHTCDRYNAIATRNSLSDAFSASGTEVIRASRSPPTLGIVVVISLRVG